MEGYTMKKLLIAALAVSALVQTGQAARPRTHKRTIVASATPTDQVVSSKAQTVDAKLKTLNEAFKQLENATTSFTDPAIRGLIGLEKETVVSLMELKTLSTNGMYSDDVITAEDIKEVETKTVLYQNFVNVLKQIDTQVKSEMSSIRAKHSSVSAATIPADVLTRAEENIKLRAQKMLAHLMLDEMPVLSNLCLYTKKIQHSDRIEDIDALEKSIVNRLDKQFIQQMGLVSSALSYEMVTGILTQNVLIFATLSQQLRTTKQNGSNLMTQCVKEIVSYARKAHDAQTVIDNYIVRRKDILSQNIQVTDPKRARRIAERILANLNKLEIERAQAYKSLVIYDLDVKHDKLQQFYNRYYSRGVIAENTSWLKPFIGAAAVAFAGYYLFGTAQGKDHVENFRKALPKNCPGHLD